jgi:uncharacterized membrane protein/uncharacterized Zn-binding protein involved in type VI secretion
MQRVWRAALMGPLAVALIVTPLLAQESFDGTYTGNVTRHPTDPSSIISIEDDTAVVTIDGSTAGGHVQFVALIDGNPGGYVTVVERATHWVDFSGTVSPDGSLEGSGLSFSSFEIVSCDGSDALCSAWKPRGGDLTGRPVTVMGSISGGAMQAEILWDGVAPAFAFQASNPAFSAPTESEYGVIVRDNMVFINTRPGEALDVTSADLPRWARGLIATVGDMYARVGPPATISGGDPSVSLNGKPIARLGDPTTVGGTIVEGSTFIFINGVPAATVGSMVVDPMITGLVPGIGGPIIQTGACPEPTINWMGTDVCAADRGRPLQDAVEKGDERITLTDDGEFAIGDGVIIGDTESTAETAIVVDKGSLVLDRPLQYDHPAGSGVMRIPAEYVDQVIAAPGTAPVANDGGRLSPLVIAALAAALGLAAWTVTMRTRNVEAASPSRYGSGSPTSTVDRMSTREQVELEQSVESIPTETRGPTLMSDQQPLSDDADAVLSALKNMGSSDYATLAIATGLSKIAISSAITDLTKRGLVTGKSGTYSPTDATPPAPASGRASKTKAATTDDPPPPPPPAASKKKPKPAAKPAAAGSDADAVLSALKAGSGTYATLATATGLSKIAVSSAITDLTKRGLVTSQSGEYSLAGATKKKPAAKAKPEAAPAKAKTKATPAAAAKKPKPATKPVTTDPDADVVLAAIKNMGSGNYADIATATGLSKIAVSSAITDLTKRGLVTGQSGEYSLAGATKKKPAAKAKAAPAAKKPQAASAASAAVSSSTTLANELEKLAALRDSGALTAAEFTKAKKKLLDND